MSSNVPTEELDSSIRAIKRVMESLPIEYIGSDHYPMDELMHVFGVLSILRRERIEEKIHEDGRVAELEAQVSKLRRIATDREYMMEAYRAMLGPVALKVVEGWEREGVVRQHTSWGPDATKLTGEERAQLILDAESQISRPLDFGDYERAAVSNPPVNPTHEGKDNGNA